MTWDYAEHAKPCEGCQNVMWGNRNTVANAFGRIKERIYR
ncbi:hypothetical protein LAD12857_13760 [Lacrimispora amygdalina]|uniref:Uncharacterized protein n=1 Tax=Lacrimispora amygdalina TaxID=253257 RepID=A0ABQ5M3C2_9FIRM